jgi:hypothetical protein
MVQSLSTSFYPKVHFKVDGSTHCLLCLIKVMSRPGHAGCSVRDALHVLSGKFSSGTKVQRSLQVLKKNKYIRVGASISGKNCWVITNAGREALLIAPRDTTRG